MPPPPADEFYHPFPRLSFKDLDTPSTYGEAAAIIKTPLCDNFIVDFGGPPAAGGRAFCALNVGADAASVAQLAALLAKPRDLTRRTRWMCVFPPRRIAEAR